MQKKLFIFIILVSFAFYSCLDYSLPEKIELEVEGSFDLPVKTSTGNWGSMLAEALKKAFSGNMGEGIEVYNVNYGQPVQAFCVYIPIKISDSLNPHDYLDGINLKEGEKALEINESIEVPSFKNFELVSLPVCISPNTDFPIGTPTDPIKTPLGVSPDFLHALIGAGCIKISLENSVDTIPVEYKIKIYQQPDNSSPGAAPSYEGFNTTLTSAVTDLENKELNKNQIEINGKITNKGGTLLEGTLKITMDLTKYKKLDWDFSNISNGLEADPVSLEDAAAKMNWIEFDKCEVDGNGEPTKGIGINVNFTELSDKLELKMSVGCDDLHLDNSPKDLHSGNNIFGNIEALTGETKRLQLIDPGKVENLNFNITLIPNRSNNVLNIKDIEAGQTLNIKGEANFFLNWTQAGVNMKEALSADLDEDGNFTGSFPDTTEEDPIDLSMLNDYLEGFSFKDITAAAYLSGPNKTIEKLSESRLKIMAHYLESDRYSIMEQQPIKLEKKHVVLQGNSDYLDKIDKDGNGTYKLKELPPDGNPLIDFEKIINAMPKDLSFSYRLDKIPPEMPVTPDMFKDENESVDILATVILLINMDLIAGDKGGKIKFPDMFNGMDDLLGRDHDGDDPNKPEKNSMFTSLDVSHIGLTIDFSVSFFSGGNLFIEKNPILFPEGILINGSTIALDITNDKFNIVKENIINPDFRLVFGKGAKITIPRNIGLTSVKIEAKGKNTFILDF